MWELSFFKYCDTTENILQWSSEEVVIPYKNPIDNKYHRYFVDVYLKAKDKSGNIVEKLIEIKPKSQTIPPNKPKTKKGEKRYLKEMGMWIKNSSKWEAAKEYCKSKNWDFVILTEEELFKS